MSIRTFIAVLLPENVRAGLAGVEKQLIASGADAKWVPAENFHITLKFLGNVEEKQLDQVFEVVREAAESTSAFDMELAGTGAFPTPSRPSVVWVGIKSGVGPLKELARKIEAGMERIGFPREERGFSGHITLGRIRSPRGSDRLRETIERLKDEPVGHVSVDSIAVMKSDLRPSGPVYTALKQFELR